MLFAGIPWLLAGCWSDLVVVGRDASVDTSNMDAVARDGAEDGADATAEGEDLTPPRDVLVPEHPDGPDAGDTVDATAPLDLPPEVDVGDTRDTTPTLDFPPEVDVGDSVDSAPTLDLPRETDVSDGDVPRDLAETSIDGACPPGQHRCASGCVDDTSVLSCGGGCVRCPTPPFAVATCAMDVCGFRCITGFADCDRNPTNGCEASEVCDGLDNDCDMLIDEGCPRSLASLGALEPSATFGVRPGTTFEDVCPEGSFVRGFHGRSGSAFDRLGLHCGTPRLVVDRMVLPYRYQIDVRPDVSLMDHGTGFGGAPFSFECPANSLVHAITGRYSGVVSLLRWECSSLLVVGSPLSGFRIERSLVSISSDLGGPGDGMPTTMFSHNCGTGASGDRWMRRMNTTFPDSLSRIEVSCTGPRLEPCSGMGSCGP